MPSESQQRYDFSCRIYGSYCRGRLGVDPTHDCGGPEMAAHALGVEEMRRPLPSLPEVVQRVAQLLSVPPAEQPAPSPAPRQLSPRVLEILGELGLDPDQFHRRGPVTAASARAQLARRAVILRLRASGMTAREIAEETLLDPWTVRAHLRAARQRPSA